MKFIKWYGDRHTINQFPIGVWIQRHPRRFIYLLEEDESDDGLNYLRIHQEASGGWSAKLILTASQSITNAASPVELFDHIDDAANAALGILYQWRRERKVLQESSNAL